MRELILFIAYKACAGRDIFWQRNYLQYRNATLLIEVFFVMHIGQLSLLTLKHLPFNMFGLPGLFTTFGGFLLLAYIFPLVFSKRVLAKSIRRFKGTLYGDYAKPIAIIYFLFNLTLIVYLISIRK